ncbi:MAG: hypothetical protein ACLR6B_13825 [Blautia sp.]
MEPKSFRPHRQIRENRKQWFFSSMVFLCIFFFLWYSCFICCFLGIRAKNGMLLLASLAFYAYGELVYVGFLMIASAFVNCLSALLDRENSE